MLRLAFPSSQVQATGGRLPCLATGLEGAQMDIFQLLAQHRQRFSLDPIENDQRVQWGQLFE